MDGVNKTLYIPLYGKSSVSKKGIILHDTKAEEIWERESFSIKGKSKSKWLCYNMAIRARIFDDWTDSMLKNNPQALILHIGCGLDSRCLRLKENYENFVDADFDEVIAVKKKYFTGLENYQMISFDASRADMVADLPDADCAIVVLEGISMYLKSDSLIEFFKAIDKKYKKINILMDTYTEYAAKMSKYKNPVNDVGVTTLYGMDYPETVFQDTNIRFVREHTMTPVTITKELPRFDRFVFKIMFDNSLYRKIYRLFEFEK